MKIVLFTSLLLAISSCKLYVLSTQKELKDESLQEVSLYLKKKRIKNYDASYFFKDDSFDSLSVAQNSFYLYRIQNGNKEGGLQCRIYDKHGKIINGYTPCFGLFNRNEALLRGDSVVPAKENINCNLNLSLETDVRFWNISESQRNNILEDTTSDYTIVALWNQRSGYLTRDMLQQLDAFKKSNPDKVRLLLVNTGRVLKE